MNTPEEHAAAVMRAPGQITVASIAGAIRAYAEEIKGSQIADADRLAKLAAVTAERDAALAQQKLGWERAAEHYRAYEQAMAERDAERTARKALEKVVKARFRHGSGCDCDICKALELASELP